MQRRKRRMPAAQWARCATLFVGAAMGVGSHYSRRRRACRSDHPGTRGPHAGEARERVSESDRRGRDKPGHDDSRGSGKLPRWLTGAGDQPTAVKRQKADVLHGGLPL